MWAASAPGTSWGEGPPAVLLHGIGRSLEDFASTAQALSATHRVHAPDVIGFGHTDKPDVDYSLPGLGRFVQHYLDVAGRNSTLWPERAAAFRKTLGHFDPALYRARLSPRPLPPLLV